MRLRREVGLGLGAVLTLQILLSALAISLLMRMGPAIERILEENVYSGEAVEDMLAVLAGDAPTATDDEARRRVFFAALERAEANVTEAAESPLLERIREGAGAALAGGEAERRALVADLRELGEVNRESMINADLRAKRLGQAGAWAAVLLGTLALALGIGVYRRLRLRLELPIDNVRRTVQGARVGNTHVRCAIDDAPAELVEIGKNVNWLLDRTLRPQPPDAAADAIARETDLRRLLAWLLDARHRPTIVVDGQGARIAASHDAMSLSPPPPPEGAGEREVGEAPAEWKIHAIPGTQVRVMEWKGPKKG
jgi:hypothetical protein